MPLWFAKTLTQETNNGRQICLVSYISRQTCEAAICERTWQRRSMSCPGTKRFAPAFRARAYAM